MQKKYTILYKKNLRYSKNIIKKNYIFTLQKQYIMNNIFLYIKTQNNNLRYS